MGKHFLRDRLAEAIPKDVLPGVPLLRLIGREELYIENYRGILEYTDALIRIQTKIGQVVLTGSGLEVVYYANDEMKVAGVIDKLEWHRAEQRRG